MNTKRYKYILFDFDGTIANSIPMQDRMMRELSVKYHMDPMGIEDFKNRDKLSVKRKAKLAAFALKVEHEYKEMYSRHSRNLLPFPGMLPLLELLKSSGYQLGVVSSNAKENIACFCSSNGLSFPVPVYSSKGLLGKEKVFSRFMQEMGCKAEDILYIGDELRDVKACQKSKIDIAFVTWGLDGMDGSVNKNIRYRIDSPAELGDLLANTWKPAM